MFKLSWVLITCSMLFFASCSSHTQDAAEDPVTEYFTAGDLSPKHIDAEGIKEEFGITFATPEGYDPVIVADVKELDQVEIAYMGPDHLGTVVLQMSKNPCNINNFKPRLIWNVLHKCIAAINSLDKDFLEADRVLDQSYHVYSSQGTYFKPGSFVQPTTIFDRKMTYKVDGEKWRFKVLGKAYRYKDKFYVVSVGYDSPSALYEVHSQAYAELLKSIQYP